MENYFGENLVHRPLHGKIISPGRKEEVVNIRLGDSVECIAEGMTRGIFDNAWLSDIDSETTATNDGDRELFDIRFQAISVVGEKE